MKIFQDIISSRNNLTVKWAASLAEKKGRNESCSFIVEGEKLTVEALKRSLPVTHIFVMPFLKMICWKNICNTP